ncbi:MAG: LysR family transcriptional regulator [Burkholderiaceae bacterium]|nr:LysR family transcriptional regulator [Burkholderiaceae bacterium]
MVTRKIDQRTAPDTYLLPRLRVSLRQLEVFVATARAGSTRAAADRVARSQSAASAALADLEAALGRALFNRVGRRLSLNEDGRALLPKAVALIDRAFELEHLFTESYAAPLRLAASLTIGEYLLPGLLAHWKLDHPSHVVRLMIGNTREVIEAVAAFEADVGFIEGMQTHPQLSVRPWLVDELTIVASRTHPLAGHPVTPRQLREATWALREHGSGTREAVDLWLLERVGPLKVEFELSSPEAIKRLVATGVALGCLAREVVASDVAQGTLVELTTNLPRASRRLSMVLHRDKHIGQHTAEFIRHCEQMDGATRRSAAA